MRHQSEGDASLNGALALNTLKITGLGNGSTAQDAAAFGQIPVASSTTTAADGTAAVGTGAYEAHSSFYG